MRLLTLGSMTPELVLCASDGRYSTSLGIILKSLVRSG